MSLNFDKVHKKHNEDSFWAAYADLYTMMSVVFLLLYVVTSLRTGTGSIQQKMETERLAAEAADLREQNRVYNTLKDNVLEQQDKAEQKVYKELMNKLTLLKEDARKEKEELRKQAAENGAKERALNQYQQIVRNIINANMLAKTGLKTRDEEIAVKKERIASLGKEVTEKNQALAESEATMKEQEQTLAEQKQTIAAKEAKLKETSEHVEVLQGQIDEKKKLISENESKIEALNNNLEKQIANLQETQKKGKADKAAAQAAIAKLKEEAAEKIGDLEQQNAKANEQLSGVSDQLGKAQGALANAEAAVAKGNAERAALEGQLKGTTEKLLGQMEGLKKGFEKEMGDAKKAFEEGLAKEKLGAAEKAAKEKAFADAAKKKADELGKQLAALGDKVKETEGKLKASEDAGRKYKDYIASLEKDKSDLADDLEKSKAQLRDKRAIADALQNAFKKNHLNANVDPKTGEVTINFPEYFDTGSAELKPSMEKQLKKLMPVYANNIFKDPKLADKIGSIEVIGFASPTYKGKYVDPESLAAEDRQAVTYNLDLSYNRAKSIFNYVFDTDTMTFKEQKRLLPLVKVTGRSYLSEAAKGKDVKSGVAIKDFCAKYDCAKEQRVVIKFNLKD